MLDRLLDRHPRLLRRVVEEAEVAAPGVARRLPVRRRRRERRADLRAQHRRHDAAAQVHLPPLRDAAPLAQRAARGGAAGLRLAGQPADLPHLVREQVADVEARQRRAQPCPVPHLRVEQRTLVRVDRAAPLVRTLHPRRLPLLTTAAAAAAADLVRRRRRGLVACGDLGKGAEGARVTLEGDEAEVRGVVARVGLDGALEEQLRQVPVVAAQLLLSAGLHARVHVVLAHPVADRRQQHAVRRCAAAAAAAAATGLPLPPLLRRRRSGARLRLHALLTAVRKLHQCLERRVLLVPSRSCIQLLLCVEERGFNLLPVHCFFFFCVGRVARLRLLRGRQ
eukprot:Rhum_TRINITY_DN12426_c0_g1::Rhum_TRINITY_DN12426_c0_g1_i1::g.51811::m.51811